MKINDKFLEDIKDDRYLEKRLRERRAGEKSKSCTSSGFSC